MCIGGSGMSMVDMFIIAILAWLSGFYAGIRHNE